MKTVLGARPDHYERLNLKEGIVAPWEDGLRTSPGQASFEWWYFDCHLEDGTRLNIEFHTKPPFLSPASPLTPFVSLECERPDGTRITRSWITTPAEFSASTERCDVRIGRSTFAGDLRSYHIRVSLDDVEADIELTSQSPPWRPATGHTFFGEKEQHYIAWLPAVPRAAVVARLNLGGRREELRGIGYHDHNWGNAALRKLVDHWYWGRARVDEYAVVALMFVSSAAYGKQPISAFMVARADELLASAVGQDNLVFTAAEPDRIAQTGVPVANRITYDFDSPQAQLSVAFLRHKDIFVLDFGKAGAYHRFAGEVTLAHRAGERTIGAARGPAMWELLYFGDRAQPADTARSRTDSSSVAIGGADRVGRPDSTTGLADRIG